MSTITIIMHSLGLELTTVAVPGSRETRFTSSVRRAGPAVQVMTRRNFPAFSQLNFCDFRSENLCRPLPQTKTKRLLYVYLPGGVFLFYNIILRTSAVSSTDFGSILIFVSFVLFRVGRDLWPFQEKNCQHFGSNSPGEKVGGGGRMPQVTNRRERHGCGMHAVVRYGSADIWGLGLRGCVYYYK